MSLQYRCVRKHFERQNGKIIKRVSRGVHMNLVDVCIYVYKELYVVVKHYILILCNFPLETPPCHPELYLFGFH